MFYENIYIISEYIIYFAILVISESENTDIGPRREIIELKDFLRILYGYYN